MDIRKTKQNNFPRIDVRCNACGCACESCMGNTFDLHQEIEEHKSALSRKDEQICLIENQVLNSVEECRKLEQSLQINTNKYERLMESHRKLQKLNQVLEEKLLKMTDTYLSQETILNTKVNELGLELSSAMTQISQLQNLSETYKRDCNMAIRLLQQKPTQFVSHHIETLPNDVQQRVNLYLAFKKSDGELSAVCSDNDASSNRSPPRPSNSLHYSIPTFPPTSINAFYSVQESNNVESNNSFTLNNASNFVSPSLMAQILEDKLRERNVPLDNVSPDDGSILKNQFIPSFDIQIESNIAQEDVYRSRHRRNLSNEIQTKQQLPSGAYYRSSTPSNIMTV